MKYRLDSAEVKVAARYLPRVRQGIKTTQVHGSWGLALKLFGVGNAYNILPAPQNKTKELNK